MNFALLSQHYYQPQYTVQFGIPKAVLEKQAELEKNPEKEIIVAPVVQTVPSIDELKSEYKRNLDLDPTQVRDFYNYARIKSVYSKGDYDYAINDLTKLFGDYADLFTEEVQDVYAQTEQALNSTHEQERISAILADNNDDFYKLEAKWKLEREVFEYHKSQASGTEPVLDSLKNAYNHYVHTKSFDYTIQATPEKELVQAAVVAHSPELAKEEITKSKDELRIEKNKRLDARMKEMEIETKAKVQAQRLERSELAEYRKAKYPTVDEAENRIYGNIDDAQGPRNFLDNTQGLFVNVAFPAYQGKTTGEIIEAKNEHHISTGVDKNNHKVATPTKDRVSATDIDHVVSLAHAEKDRTHKVEKGALDGNFELNQAKHRTENEYFQLRVDQAVDNKLGSTTAFHQAYTDYARIENADRIAAIEAKYPQQTKAISAEHQDQRNTVLPERVSMRPKRDGFITPEAQAVRHAQYGARRMEKLADQANAQIESITKKTYAEQHSDMKEVPAPSTKVEAVKEAQRPETKIAAVVELQPAPAAIPKPQPVVVISPEEQLRKDRLASMEASKPIREFVLGKPEAPKSVFAQMKERGIEKQAEISQGKKEEITNVDTTEQNSRTLSKSVFARMKESGLEAEKRKATERMNGIRSHSM